MPADFSRAGLVAEAGVDPWTLWEPLSQGAPDTVRTAGGHFRIAGEQAATAAQEGRDADLAMAAAYTSENQAVFDAPRSTGEGRVLLSDDGQLMEEAARIVIGIGDGLEEARTLPEPRYKVWASTSTRPSNGATTPWSVS